MNQLRACPCECDFAEDDHHDFEIGDLVVRIQCSFRDISVGDVATVKSIDRAGVTLIGHVSPRGNDYIYSECNFARLDMTVTQLASDYLGDF